MIVEVDEPLGRRWPRPLVPGDTVALVSPSGPSAVEAVDAAEALLHRWGFRVRRGAHVVDRHPGLRYLAGTDADRAADLQAAWTDPEVAAVWAVRGGYGAQRMIDLLDLDALRAAGPRHLLGFSDITALHARIGAALGQVTLHAPTATSRQLDRAVNADRVRALLVDGAGPGTTLLDGRPLADGSARGTATGRLIGGNLSLIASDVGIEPPPAVPSVVLLEDVDEESYRLDRQLTQLRRSGWFEQVTGVVLGDFTLVDDASVVEAVLAERLGDLGVPVLRSAPVGHADTNLAVPLGAAVRLEVGSGTAVLRAC